MNESLDAPAAADLPDALVLFAHGARDPAWARPFEHVAEALRRERPSLDVRLAFLELMQPDLPATAAALAAAGRRRVAIVPMFLGAGGHVRRDLPLLVERLGVVHPATAWALHAPIGEHPDVLAAMSRAALTLAEASTR